MSDILKADLLCREARSIIVRSEDVVRCMKTAGACEGHLLMADQGLVALRHRNTIIERSRKRYTLDAPSDAVSAPIAAKQRWWSVPWRRRGAEGGMLETGT